jgi:hypothetical protein
MAEPQDTAADRAAAGTVADETARLVEALGVWATSVSSSSRTTGAASSRTTGAASSRTTGQASSRTTPPPSPSPRAPGVPATATQQTPPEASDQDPRDDPGADQGAAPEQEPRHQEPRHEAPPDAGRCEQCGATTGVGQAVSCHVCPICQGIALLRTVRPETVDRLADLAGSVAATLREVAAHVRTPAHQPGGPADGSDGAPTGRAGPAQTGAGGPGAPRGPATVQDIPVGDGDSSDEGDEW